MILLSSTAHAATLTTTSLTTTGSSIASAALTAVAAGGDQCPNDGRTFVVLKNSSGSNTYTISTSTPATTYGAAIADASTSVAVSADLMWGPFPTAIFNDSGGYVNFTYTGTAPATDLKIKCFRLP